MIRGPKIELYSNENNDKVFFMVKSFITFYLIQDHTTETCSFIKKETLAQFFSCEFCEISKNTSFTEHLWATASVNKMRISKYQRKLKPKILLVLARLDISILNLVLSLAIESVILINTP